jgi:hypothetical protein
VTVSETRELRVTFHKRVVASREHFSLVGARQGAVRFGVTLANGGSVGVVTPAEPLAFDTYTLTVSDGVVDGASGQRLDGEMDAAGTLPSGDGLPGGSAAVSFTVVRDMRRKVPAAH